MTITELAIAWNEEKEAIKKATITTAQGVALVSEMNELTGESLTLNEAISHKAKINVLHR